MKVTIEIPDFDAYGDPERLGYTPTFLSQLKDEIKNIVAKQMMDKLDIRTKVFERQCDNLLDAMEKDASEKIIDISKKYRSKVNDMISRLNEGIE